MPTRDLAPILTTVEGNVTLGIIIQYWSQKLSLILVYVHVFLKFHI